MHLIAVYGLCHGADMPAPCEYHMNRRNAPLTFAAQHSIYAGSRRRSEPIGLDGSRLKKGGWSKTGDRHEDVLSYAIPARPPRLLERIAGAYELYGPRVARHRHRSRRHSRNRPPGLPGTALISMAAPVA